MFGTTATLLKKLQVNTMVINSLIQEGVCTHQRPVTEKRDVMYTTQHMVVIRDSTYTIFTKCQQDHYTMFITNILLSVVCAVYISPVCWRLLGGSLEEFSVAHSLASPSLIRSMFTQTSSSSLVLSTKSTCKGSIFATSFGCLNKNPKLMYDNRFLFR